MSYLPNNQQKLNDIIFANRNKNYGAYAIRSEYGETVFKSLALVSLGMGSLMFVAYYLSLKQSDIPDLTGPIINPESVYVVPFKKIPDEKLVDKKKPTTGEPAKPTKDLKSSTLVITDSLPAQNKLVVASDPIVSTTLSATPSDGSGSRKTLSIGNDTIEGSTGNEVSVQPFEDFNVDSVPEFEGGPGALKRFIASVLEYPELASDLRKGGTVHVKFIVDERGKVNSPGLLNKVGYGMDEEAIRVVKLIPDFKKPAKAHGRAVKFYFRVPIKFVAQ